MPNFIVTSFHTLLSPARKVKDLFSYIYIFFHTRRYKKNGGKKVDAWNEIKRQRRNEVKTPRDLCPLP